MCFPDCAQLAYISNFLKHITPISSAMPKWISRVNWACNKKMDNQLRVMPLMPLIFGYTFRFQIPL
ncbi:MAG: hypothetical protein CMH44_01010, partial [Muricauda sp.]|nr:hypothetical protein [Allomuricauda sp.]